MSSPSDQHNLQSERASGGECAIIVHPEFRAGQDAQDAQEECEEFEELARAAGVRVAEVLRAPIKRPNPRFFIGSGKTEELQRAVTRHAADVVLVNHRLAPIQERNLEREVQARVFDRTTLILDIFAQRAQSRAGKLQVELAQLRHLSTRLVRGWTHLERQKGGIGLRGPGETQLETDRRLLGQRIRTLRQRLQEVDRQRSQGRRSRRRNNAPVVSLVGYTNAGKSTLFNALTEAQVFAADQLFATLDPTVRKVKGLTSEPILLADTVGFVRHLPHELIAAFQSTLEETRDADLLLHVVDAADPLHRERMLEVQAVLAEISADEIPQLEVFNKIDQRDESPHVERDEQGQIHRVWVSALRGQGLELISDALRERFAHRSLRTWLRLPAAAGRLRARLFELDAVCEERVQDHGGWSLKIDLPRHRARQLATLDGEEGRIVREQLLSDGDPVGPSEDEVWEKTTQ